MKRKILLLTSIILSALPIALAAQMTYVPDDNFEQALIDKGYDSGQLNDSVPTKNIDTLTYLNVMAHNISDLTGIEDFIALEILWCNENQLTSLDVSNNSSLQDLECYVNQITSLDLSNNGALVELRCSSNQLMSLNVSNNSSLEIISCNDNLLTSLDLSKSSALKGLNCSGNMITVLDLTKNPALTGLFCYDNELSVLDISKNFALGGLYCYNNQLTSLDVSKNPLLKYIHCYHNQLPSIDVSKNPDLKELFCNINMLTSLDVSKNHVLKTLICHDNMLKNLNIKNGNNKNMYKLKGEYFDATNNPDLFCIQVDDSMFSATNSRWVIDSTAHYSENCNYTAVEDNKFENEAAAISPNPATDYIELSLPPRPPGEGRGEGIRIYNILGEIVFGSETNSVPFDSNVGTCKINISALPQGTYFIRIGGEIKKFIKF